MALAVHSRAGGISLWACGAAVGWCSSYVLFIWFMFFFFLFIYSLT